MEWVFAYPGGRAMSGHTIPTNVDKVICLSRMKWTRFPKLFSPDMPRSLLVNMESAKVPYFVSCLDCLC